MVYQHYSLPYMEQDHHHFIWSSLLYLETIIMVVTAAVVASLKNWQQSLLVPIRNLIFEHVKFENHQLVHVTAIIQIL